MDLIWQQQLQNSIKTDWKSIFLCLTIGLPFCAFKILCGLVAEREGFQLTGYILISWGTVDFLLNFIRILSALFKRRPISEFCFLATIGRLFNQAPILMAIDTLLAFLIICLVLWSGWITKLSGIEIIIWYIATTVNLLSVAIVQIWCVYHSKQEKAEN